MLEKLEERSRLADRLIELCRNAKRKAAKAIEEIVEKGRTEVEFEELEEIERIIEEDRWLMGLLWGSIRTAMQEIAEALILKKAVEENRIELPGIAEHSDLTGLADAIGEMKRYFLKRIIEGNVKEAERILRLAEKGYRLLAEVHYQQSVVPELKRKRDVARGVVVSMLQIMAEIKSRC